MDHRRSWPWKKKSSSESKNEVGDAIEPVSRAAALDAEEKNRALNHKLTQAASELNSKENLVKQHVKVAEEAVSGWEKAEKEATLLKKHLESSTQQKSFLENRVTHLEGALKECMRELRTVREEHEQKLQETVARMSRERDKSRAEMESRLAASSEKLIESEAARSALSRSLQERSRIVSELTEAKAQLGVELAMVQAKMEESEKSCSTLRYEAQVLAREVEIRNEERDFNKKIADSSSKQQQESARKIAKLEAECQRLRGLVRKKLPGPGALAQMRLEAEPPGSPRATNKMDVQQPSTRESDEQQLVERLTTMEEETKMLKESLAKKNQELQSARLMCARTASKLSLVEEQLERGQGPGKSACRAPVNRNEISGPDSCSADSWASALVAQLEHFRKGKEEGSQTASSGSGLFGSSSLEIMDDFAEMERLATASSSSSSGGAAAVGDEKTSYEEALTKKERECLEARELCDDLRSKLLAAEEQVRRLEKNHKNKESMILTDMDRLFAEARNRSGVRPDESLRSIVGELVQVVESLAVLHESIDRDEVKQLVSSGNNLVNHGAGDLLEFLRKLSGVLNFLESTKVSSSSSSETDYSSIQDDNMKLRAEKASMEQELGLAGERIERLKSQLSVSEQLVSNLRVQLQSLEASKQLAESQLAEMAGIKAELESKFRASCIEMARLQENVTSLESELHEQKRKRHQELSSPTSQQQQLSPEDHAARMQEREIAAAAEKLADCQRTIIALGKQLNSFTLQPPGSSRGSIDLSEASESSSGEKIHQLNVHQGFSLKPGMMVQSESDDEEVEERIPKWKVQRSVSDMSRVRNARENIRKQEIYWSSAVSPPELENNCHSSAEKVRKPSEDGELFAASPLLEDRSSSNSYASKNSGFSRFFHRRGNMH